MTIENIFERRDDLVKLGFVEGKVTIIVTDNEDNDWVQAFVQKHGLSDRSVLVTKAEIIRLQILHGDVNAACRALTYPRPPGSFVARATTYYENPPPLAKKTRLRS